MVKYQGNHYYAWESTDGGEANIGKFDGTSTYTDSWWTGTLSATALQTSPKYIPMEVGNNDVMYFGNRRYVGSYDGTTALDKALDLPTGYEVADLTWLNDRLYIPTNYNDSNIAFGSVYIWDGTTNSWEAEIPVVGTLGGGIENNGTYYQFYFDRNGEGRLARMDGNRFADLTRYPSLITPGYAYGNYPNSSLPSGNQITVHKDYLLWMAGAGNDIWGYGPLSNGGAKLFKFADARQNGTLEGGVLSNAVTNPGILFSSGAQLYSLDTYGEDGTLTYETASSWKSTLFDITGDRINAGQVNGIRFNFEALTSGAALNWSLVNNQGKTIYSDTISYAKATASSPLHTLTTAFYPLNGLVTDNFRVELDFSNGSTTAPVRVMNIKCYGEG